MDLAKQLNGRSSVPMIEAVVFDFDGTVLDTETPVYEAWKDTFVAFGVEPISFDQWVESIGLSGRQFDPPQLLSERLGRPVDRAEVEGLRRERRDAAINALGVRDGVLDWLNEAAAAGVGLAVASSSPREWVGGHLDSRGLLSHFSHLFCAGDPLPDKAGTVPGKPDPTSYLLACEALEVNPANAVAVEDSPHGISAANEAGLFTVATPGPMTSHFDFSHASLILDSLGDRSIADVAALILAG